MWSEALASAGNLGSAALLHDWRSPSPLWIFLPPQAEGKPLSVYGSLIKVALSKMAAKRSRQHKLNADCFWKEAHANWIRPISLIIQKLTATLKHVCISDEMTFFAELLTQSGSRKSQPGWLLAITWWRFQWELQITSGLPRTDLLSHLKVTDFILHSTKAHKGSVHVFRLYMIYMILSVMCHFFCISTIYFTANAYCGYKNDVSFSTFQKSHSSVK